MLLPQEPVIPVTLRWKDLCKAADAIKASYHADINHLDNQVEKNKSVGGRYITIDMTSGQLMGAISFMVNNETNEELLDTLRYKLTKLRKGKRI